MSSEKKRPGAVVGVGRMGRHHVRNYYEMDQADLLAVVDSDEERAGAAADQFGCDSLRTVSELLEKYPEVRAATVAVPTVNHVEVSELLMSNGVACLIEKPLAQSVVEARKIVEISKRCGVLAQVGHTERFNPAVRAIREWDFTPRFIEVDRVSPMTFRSVDVGVVFDMMIHDIDIVLMMVQSPLKEVHACGVSVLGEHEDVADARLEFEDGCVCKITVSRLALKTERKLRVMSEKGYISLDYAKKSGIALQRTGNIEAVLAVRDELAAGKDLSELDYADIVNIHELKIDDEEPLRGELTNFLDAVSGKTEPEVDVEAGCAAVEVAEEIVKKIREHKWAGLDEKTVIK